MIFRCLEERKPIEPTTSYGVFAHYNTSYQICKLTKPFQRIEFPCFIRLLEPRVFYPGLAQEQTEPWHLMEALYSMCFPTCPVTFFPSCPGMGASIFPVALVCVFLFYPVALVCVLRNCQQTHVFNGVHPSSLPAPPPASSPSPSLGPGLVSAWQANFSDLLNSVGLGSAWPPRPKLLGSVRLDSSRLCPLGLGSAWIWQGSALLARFRLGWAQTGLSLRSLSLSSCARPGLARSRLGKPIFPSGPGSAHYFRAGPEMGNQGHLYFCISQKPKAKDEQKI